MVASVSVSVKNKGPGLRVFKNVYNQDIPIQPGDSRTFDMHPHLVRMLDRDAQKKESTIELHVDDKVLAEVKSPGGNITEDEQRATELHRLQEKQRLERLRQEGGIVPGQELHVDRDRFIVDPKTVPDDKGGADGSGSSDETKGSGAQAPKTDGKGKANAKQNKKTERVRLTK